MLPKGMPSLQPLVSIALCTYNGQEHISELLNSVINQTYQNLEIVIVDDCSKDDTLQIIRRFSRADSRIKISVNSNNIGFNKNFELAISATSGDFVCICDQDDVWLPQKVERLLAHLKDNWVIFSNSSLIDATGAPLNKTLINSDRLLNTTYKSFLFENVLTGHTSLIKREFLKYYLPIPEFGFYDWYMGFAASYHHKLVYLNEELTLYRIHGASVTQSELQASNKMRNKEAKYKFTLGQLNCFLSYQHLKHEDKCFLQKLVDAYRAKAYRFSLPLFFMIFKNYQNLFKKERHGLSKLNFCYKFSKQVRLES